MFSVMLGLFLTISITFLNLLVLILPGDHMKRMVVMVMMLMLFALCTGLTTESVESTESAETNVHINIGKGYGVVSQVINVNTTTGFQYVSLNFYRNVLPSSITISSSCLEIISQNYKDVTRVLEDKQVMITTVNGNVYSGKVVSMGDNIVIDTGTQTVFVPMDNIDNIIYSGPSLPTLSLYVNSHCTGNGENPINVMYMTNGLSWSAKYNAIYENGMLRLVGFADITNNAGDYDNADVTLVSGDVNRVYQDYEDYGKYRPRILKSYASAPVSEDSYQETEAAQSYEYHTYHIPVPVNLRYGETTTVSIVNFNVSAEKKYTYTIPFWYSTSRSENDPVDVSIEFYSEEPLPSGIVRVYTDNGYGGYMLAGEDYIKDTPINEKVILNTGKAFDVRASLKKTSHESYGSRMSEDSYEVKLSNHKNQTVSVEVYAQMPRWVNWEITQSTEPYDKESATKVKWVITLPPNTEKTLTYTVKTWW